MRFRFVYMFVAFALFPLFMLITDPDLGMIQNVAYGAQFVQFVLNSMAIFLFVGLLHFSRKALFDYEDLQMVRNKAMETATGAGLWAGAISVFVLAVAIIIHAVIAASAH